MGLYLDPGLALGDDAGPPIYEEASSLFPQQPDGLRSYIYATPSDFKPPPGTPGSSVREPEEFFANSSSRRPGKPATSDQPAKAGQSAKKTARHAKTSQPGKKKASPGLLKRLFGPRA